MDENTKQNIAYLIRGIDFLGVVCLEQIINQRELKISWNDIRDAAMKMQKEPGIVRIVIDVAIPYQDKNS